MNRMTQFGCQASGMQSSSHLLQGNVADTVAKATPAKRKRGKALSRRTGQNGHIEASGKWFVVRFWKDIEGQEKRALVRERICPISGPGSLNRSERERRAREIIAEAQVDTAQYFNRVVMSNSTSVSRLKNSRRFGSNNRRRGSASQSALRRFQPFRRLWTSGSCLK